MSSINRIFECSRCGHTTIIQVDPPKCRECGSMTGVIKAVDVAVIGRLVKEGSRPWMEGGGGSDTTGKGR
jgi:hypothetical protein